MAVESPEQVVTDLSTNGRKRSASEVIDNPNYTKKVMIMHGCALNTHSNDKEDPQGHNCSAFESEFGTYDSKLFIDQNEAEDLLSTLESLAGMGIAFYTIIQNKYLKAIFYKQITNI